MRYQLSIILYHTLQEFREILTELNGGYLFFLLREKAKNIPNTNSSKSINPYAGVP